MLYGNRRYYANMPMCIFDMVQLSALHHEEYITLTPQEYAQVFGEVFTAADQAQ